MDIMDESYALEGIRELEIQLEADLKSTRNQAREIMSTARETAFAMVTQKEKELSKARRAVLDAGYGTSGLIRIAETDGKNPEDDLVRTLAGELLKTIIR